MKAKRTLIPILRLGGRILLIGLCLFLGLIAYLLVRESITRSKYQADYPPPGQMVSLETHAIHLHCMGTGNPTVVFEADLDQYGSLTWDSVQGEIGSFTRACSYDRAGTMWSEPGPRPRDGETIAGELAAVLDAAGKSGPYVLVGHAFGGVYVRIFAGQNPDAVCGMVLVDSSHPEMFTRFAEFGIEQEIPDKQIRPLIQLLSHLGMPGRFKGNLYNLSADVYDPQQAFLPESSMAWFDESVEGPNTLKQAERHIDLDDMPLIVLASARPSIQVKDRDLQDVWLELQQELTSLSDNGEIRMLPESGHYIQFDQPQEVIEAVRDVVQRCAEAAP
ncbi:MAG: alpha/beta hydrolase [Anaerolineae bacterium]|nr:alpha/beta hydrolase [Anaerolineae bacterium]